MLRMQRPGRWTWVHLASLVGILSALVVLSRGQWFFGDEWDFLLFRGVAHPAVGVFYPHNEHWSTLPILWYRAVFQVFALRSYWPYLLSLFAIHLAVVHLLWRCVIRAGVPASIATVGAAAFGLFGAGSENLLWAFQIGFVGSLAAGLGLGLAVNGPPERRRVALVVRLRDFLPDDLGHLCCDGGICRTSRIATMGLATGRYSYGSGRTRLRRLVEVAG